MVIKRLLADSPLEQFRTQLLQLRPGEVPLPDLEQVLLLASTHRLFGTLKPAHRRFAVQKLGYDQEAAHLEIATHLARIEDALLAEARRNIQAYRQLASLRSGRPELAPFIGPCPNLEFDLLVVQHEATPTPGLFSGVYPYSIPKVLSELRTALAHPKDDRSVHYAALMLCYYAHVDRFRYLLGGVLCGCQQLALMAIVEDFRRRRSAQMSSVWSATAGAPEHDSAA